MILDGGPGPPLRHTEVSIWNTGNASIPSAHPSLSSCDPLTNLKKFFSTLDQAPIQFLDRRESTGLDGLKRGGYTSADLISSNLGIDEIAKTVSLAHFLYSQSSECLLLTEFCDSDGWVNILWVGRFSQEEAWDIRARIEMDTGSRSLIQLKFNATHRPLLASLWVIRAGNRFVLVLQILKNVGCIASWEQSFTSDRVHRSRLSHYRLRVW